MNLTLIYPLSALVFLTAMIVAVMFVTRVRAARGGKLHPGYFKTYDQGNPPEDVVKTQRHYANLFEIPVLFYAGGILAVVLPVQSVWASVWMWLFVFARGLHAYIHIGPNKLRPRMLSFALGLIAVFALWIEIVLNVSTR
jgi:hypothetical protein